ncbi:MAG: hypothetical protein ACLGQH_07740 [Acidobacteriota bacterium]
MEISSCQRLPSWPPRRRLIGRIVLLALVAFTLAASPALATTYYVDPAGSNTGGTTWATAFTTVQAALITAQGGDTVEISGGVYNENLTSQATGVLVTGSAASGHNGTVTIRGGTGQPVLTVNHQTTWRRLVLDGSANTDPAQYVVWIENAASPTFEQCRIGPGQRLLNIKTGGAAFTRCTISGARVAELKNSSATNVVYINAGTADVSFSYCLLSDMGFGYIHAQSAGRIDCNNCLLAGFNGTVLYVQPAAAIPNGVFWTNCLAMSNGYAADAVIQNDSSAVAVTVTKSLVEPRTPFNLTSAKYLGAVSETGGLSGSPLLVHGRRKAMINLGIDDAGSIPFWSQLAAACAPYGFKTTLALNTAAVTPGDWPTVQIGVDSGHEVASHTAHHVYLAGPASDPSAKPSLFSLRYTGTSGSQALLAIDRSGASPLLTVTVAGDSAANVSLPLAATGAYPAVADLKAFFDAMPTKYACTLTTIPGTSYDSGSWLSQDAEAVAATDIKAAALTVSVDETAATQDELIAPKQTIEAALHSASGGAYSVDALVYPYEGVNALAMAAAKAAGYRTARSSANGDFALGAADGYNVMDIFCTEPSLIFGTDWTTEAELAQRVSPVLEWAKFTGLGISLFSHNQPGEFTLAQWQTLLGVLAQDPEIEIVTLRQLYDYVAANSQSADGGLTYVRTAAWPDVVNYQPQYASQLIGAGAPYAVSRIDFGGNAVPAGTIPKVGLYQAAQPKPGSTGISAVYKLLLLR